MSGMHFEFSGKRVLVVGASCGGIITRQSARSRSNPEHVSAVNARTPMSRWGEPEDIAGPALFLLSSAAGFMTGTCLSVDGGYSVV